MSHGRVEEYRGVRRRVLKNATIVFRQGYSTMPCGVLDLSGEGARLLPALPWFCPNEFILKFDVGGSRNCRVIWRREAELGVQFFPEASSINRHAATQPVTMIEDKLPVQAVELAGAPLGLREAFAESIIATQGDPHRGALAVMSISNLAVVKTAYGTETAAIVLGTVEQRLQKVLRGLDVMGRLGDDKFGIVLAHCKPEHASTVADRFVSAVQSEPIVTRDALISAELSTSIMVPSGNKSLFALIESAEPLPRRPLQSDVLATGVPPLNGPQSASKMGSILS